MSEKYPFLRVGCFLLLVTAALVSYAQASEGHRLYRQARIMEQGASFIKARTLYQQAREQLEAEGNTNLAQESAFGTLRMDKILATYPHTEQDVRRMIRDKYPDATRSQIDEVIDERKLPQILIGGEIHYFESFLNTLYHVYPAFRRREEKGALGRVSKLFDIMSPYLYETATHDPGKTRLNPIHYEAEGRVTVSRDRLGQKGLLRIWAPLPLITPHQTDVEIVSIEPRQYVKYPLKLNGDIGLVYLEVPLDELTDDLTLSTHFTMTRYEKRFSVDPGQVGPFDKSSALYERYTQSAKNIAITRGIRDTAQEVVGEETNPYLAAKKLYEHVVYETEYSYTPHMALEALNIPESVYVHEHRYGDCGAQSMYFAALCRAAGIPARAAGGMQLFPGSKTGCADHFWTQIYLPNYGWIPVDPSVGQIARYMPDLPEDKRDLFIQYFFGNLDPFRYLIQVDVDLPLIPDPDRPRWFELVLQSPIAVCAGMQEDPGALFSDHWEMRFRRIPHRD